MPLIDFGRRATYRLQAVVSAGEKGEPVVTIMPARSVTTTAGNPYFITSLAMNNDKPSGFWDDAEVISSYTREQAIADGANLTEALAKAGWSEALASKLREEEVQLGKLKTERSAAAKETGARVVPHPAAIAGYLKSLFTLLDTDPVRGREILSRFVAPIVMTPESEGPARRYRATGAFNLAYFLNAVPNGSGKSSCAGANSTLETAAVIPFEFHAKRPPDGRNFPETWKRRVA